jgi:hypothetical protein
MKPCWQQQGFFRGRVAVIRPAIINNQSQIINPNGQAPSLTQASLNLLTIDGLVGNNGAVFLCPPCGRQLPNHQ